MVDKNTCSIKYKVDEEVIYFKFKNLDDIPNNIVYLFISDQTNDIGDPAGYSRFKDIEELYLNNCKLSLTSLTKCKKLKKLDLTSCDSDNNVVFPDLNIEELNIEDNTNIENLDLNKLYNLKKLTLETIYELENLYIDKLKNLKTLTLYGLDNLKILNFENSCLDFLDVEHVDLEYINGYFKDYDISPSEKLNISNVQKILSRRRIYLISESFRKENFRGTQNGLAELKESCEGPYEGCICGNCKKYILSSKKINLRNFKIKYSNYFNEGNGLYSYIKILSCC